MNRTVFNTMLALAAAVMFVTAGAVAKESARTYRPATMRPASARVEHKEPVTLAIHGAADRLSAQVLTSVLKEQGLEANVREERGRPYELTASIPRSMDLSGCGKAVMSAKTTERATIPPSFDFVLFAPLTKEKAKQAIDRLRGLKGVDVKNSRASVKQGELWVRINGAARVTPDDVYNAIHAAGIDCHFTKQAGRPS